MESKPPMPKVRRVPYIERRIGVGDKLKVDYLRERLASLTEEGEFATRSSLVSAINEFYFACLSHPLTARIFDRPGRKSDEANIDDKKSGILNGSDLNKFITGGPNLGERKVRAIVYFLHEHDLWSPQNIGSKIAALFPDPLFHSVQEFLGIEPDAALELAESAVGVYRAFRPSIMYHDHFAAGYLEISKSPDSSALKTYELYKSSGHQGRLPKAVTYEGCFFRGKGTHFILGRNNAWSSIQYILLPDVETYRDMIQVMFGALTDMSTKSPYTSPIFFERIDNGIALSDQEKDRLKKEPDIISRERMPESLLDFFDRKIPPNMTLY